MYFSSRRIEHAQYVGPMRQGARPVRTNGPNTSFNLKLPPYPQEAHFGRKPALQKIQSTQSFQKIKDCGLRLVLLTVFLNNYWRQTLSTTPDVGGVCGGLSIECWWCTITLVINSHVDMSIYGSVAACSWTVSVKLREIIMGYLPWKPRYSSSGGCIHGAVSSTWLTS